MSAPDLPSQGQSDDVVDGYRTYVPDFAEHAKVLFGQLFFLILQYLLPQVPLWPSTFRPQVPRVQRPDAKVLGFCCIRKWV